MYTEFVFAAELKEDLSQEIVAVLEYLTRKRVDVPQTPEHEFFRCERWRSILRSDSYYFPGKTHSSFDWDDIVDQYFLTVRSSLKNHDSEIEKFVAWITPYLAETEGTFLGHKRHELATIPTLIFHPNNLVIPEIPQIQT